MYKPSNPENYEHLLTLFSHDVSEEKRDKDGKWTTGGSSDAFKSLTETGVLEFIKRHNEHPYTPEEAHAIFRYTRAFHNHANAYLRRGTPIPERHAGLIEPLLSAVGKETLPESVVLYRGARLDPNQLAELKPGAVVSDKGFASTSLNRNTAFYGEHETAYMAISAPKGSSVILAYNHANIKDEAEIMLPPNHQLRIDSVTEKNGKKFVQATLLPSS